MNRCFFLFLLVLLSLALSGCAGTEREYRIPEFKEYVDAEFDVIGDVLYGLNAISDIEVYGSYIIVTAVNLEDSQVVHIYDKETGEHLKDAIRLGRGPKELLYPRISNLDRQTGIHTFFDASKSAVLTYQVDSLLYNGLSAVGESSYNPQVATTHRFDVGNRSISIHNVSFLWRDTTTLTRIEVSNRDGEILSSYNGYPYFEDDRKRYLAYNDAVVALSPDFRKMAVVTIWGGILELFSIEDTKIDAIYTGYLVEPEFDVVGNGMYLRLNENTLDSFSDVYATQDNVFASFGGRVRLKNSGGEVKYSDIVIFDWKGRAIKRVHTKHQIKRICVDGDMVYAVLNDANGNVVLGRFYLT